jgi:integrase
VVVGGTALGWFVWDHRHSLFLAFAPLVWIVGHAESRAGARRATAELPPRIDTPLLFPGGKGGHLSLHEWRRDVWTPALRAADLAHRGPYALRHTYASFAIAAGVSLFELARFMGTSVDQIDRTCGHLLPDSLERTRSALDAFVAPNHTAAAEGR